MTEYTKEVINDMVSNFMRAYETEVEKNGLGPARAFADAHLMGLSKDMPQEAADNFVKACMGPLNAFLQGQIDDADTAAEEDTDDIEAEHLKELTEEAMNNA
jgi:hypothetical protein